MPWWIAVVTLVVGLVVGVLCTIYVVKKGWFDVPKDRSLPMELPSSKEKK